MDRHALDVLELPAIRERLADETSFAGGEASFLSLEPEVQEADRMAWAGAYLSVDPTDYPNTWQIRGALPEVTDDEIFETLLTLVMGGLLRRAPKPCGCSRHASEHAVVDVTLSASR